MRCAAASSPTSTVVALALLKSFIFPYYPGVALSCEAQEHGSVSRTCNPPPVRPQPDLKHWLISLTGSSDTTRSARRRISAAIPFLLDWILPRRARTD